MSELFKTGIVVSRGNSTSTPLYANTEFIGATEDVTSYEEIDINVAGNPYNAPGSLYFEFSPDTIHWDVSILVGGSQYPGPNLVPQFLRIILPYFRVRYINGSISQTEFRLTVVYHRSSGSRLTRFLNQHIDDTEGTEMTRAFVSGKRTDGYYDNIQINTDNILLVDGSTVTQPVTGFVVADQGIPAALADRWPVTLTDGINSVAVKPASTAAATTDPALVVAISPNNAITTSTAHSSTNNITNIAASTTNTLLLASNSIRLGATIYNDSAALLYISLGSVATLNDYTIKLFPLGYYEVPYGFIGAVDGFWSSAIGFAKVGELT
jgi:hypothetical protein